MTGPGHNSIAADQLRSYIERVERLESERSDIQAAVREVFAEAKANGFDPKIMRAVIKLRAMDPGDREEQTVLLDIYMRALGINSGVET